MSEALPSLPLNVLDVCVYWVYCERKMTRDYLLPLVSKEVIADNTMAFTFGLEGTNYTFRPGQYAYFTLNHLPNAPHDSNTRIFSFTHTPNGKHLNIIMRLRPSSYKIGFAALKPGDIVHVSSPLGFFELHDNTAQPAVFLAGGVGIAPFCSLIEHAIHQESAMPIHLFTSNRTYRDAVYMDKIDRYREEHPHLLSYLAFTQEEEDLAHYGRLSAETILPLVPHATEAIYYLCGSTNFVEHLSEQLQEAGIPLGQIKQEAFTGYERHAHNLDTLE